MTVPATNQASPATPGEALRIAVDLLGSQAALARLVGVSQPSVHGWLKAGQMPADDGMVIKVEEATGVSRHDLRPDIYPRPDADRPLEPAR